MVDLNHSEVLEQIGAPVSERVQPRSQDHQLSDPVFQRLLDHILRKPRSYAGPTGEREQDVGRHVAAEPFEDSQCLLPGETKCQVVIKHPGLRIVSMQSSADGRQDRSLARSLHRRHFATTPQRPFSDHAPKSIDVNVELTRFAGHLETRDDESRQGGQPCPRKYTPSTRPSSKPGPSAGSVTAVAPSACLPRTWASRPICYATGSSRTPSTAAATCKDVLTSEERKELVRRRRENRDLREAQEILKACRSPENCLRCPLSFRRRPLRVIFGSLKS